MLIQIKNIFDEVYRKYSGNPLFELNLENEINRKVLVSFSNNFLKTYNGSIDNEFLLQYIIFQFKNYENAKTRFGKGKVYLNWIFGKKALKRWEGKPENWLYWNEQFIRKHNIKRISESVEVNSDSKNFSNSLERRRFFNTERGLIHCTELDLFEKYCKDCLICKYKYICDVC